MTSSAAAFGLSDRQTEHIAKYIKCKTYLLTGDLVSFEDDPDCGGSNLETRSIGSTRTPSTRSYDPCDYDDYPNEVGRSSLLYDGGSYCPSY